MLTGFLDWYRQVVVNKAEGLTLEQASTVMTPTGLSPLGILKHLAWAESIWFRGTFTGGEPERIPNEESFRLAPDDTVDSVVAR